MRLAAESPHGADRRIRVAFCIDNLGTGGTELNAVRTAERLDPSRFALTLVTLLPDGALRSRYEAAGIRVAPFPVGGLYRPNAVRELIRLARFLRDERIDILHSHDHYDNVFATTAARLAGVPLVIASRRWWQSPRRLHGKLNAIATRRADRVLANCRALATVLETQEGVARERIVVLPNFVGDDAFEPIVPSDRARMLRSLGVPDDAIVVGIVATLSAVKDHGTLLRAVARLAPTQPRLHAVLVGGGECRPELERLASDLRISDRVHFAGHRPQRPNPHAMFDLSALCSTSEGFPNSIVEAMAAGRAVVSTNVGGCVDAVREGETGLLVPPSNPEAFASAIARLADDRVLRERMGIAAQRVARTAYHERVVIPRLERFYADALAASSRARGHRAEPARARPGIEAMESR
jgi:glycosyltransferase involved in cell wall biosynthesis